LVERGIEDWFSLLTKEFLPRAFPEAARQGRIQAHNGCIPATQSEMAQLCLDRVLGGGGGGGAGNGGSKRSANSSSSSALGEEQNNPPHDPPPPVDLVLVEFTVNDGWAGSSSPDHPRARAFERLLRKLLLGKGGGKGGKGTPSPAVVLVHLLPTDAHRLGTPFYASAETDYDVLARYYGLASVSLRAALWQRLAAAQPGFSRNDVFPPSEERHPTPLGHRYVADLIVWLLQRAVLEDALGLLPYGHNSGGGGDGGGGDSSSGDSISLQGRRLPHARLGPPVFPGNEASRTQACLMAEDLPAAVVVNKGWQWVDDAKPLPPAAAAANSSGSAKQQHASHKWGFAADEPGATLVLRLDTRAHDRDEDEDEEGGKGGGRRLTAEVLGADEVAAAERQGLLLPPPPMPLPALERPAPLPPGRRRLRGGGGKGRSAKRDPAPPPPPPPPPSAAAPPATPSPQQQPPLAPLDPDDLRVPADQTLPPPGTPRSMAVWIGHVASWRGAGRAIAWCARYCACDAKVLDGWHAQKTTQQVAGRLGVTPSPRCWVALRVLNETTTPNGGRRFKVTGAMVGRRAEEGLFGDASELTVMEAFNPGGAEGAVAGEEEESESG
jgi:hypothetical protein